MLRSRSLSSHLKKLAVGWALFGLLVTIPLGLGVYYAFQFLNAGSDLTTSSQGLIAAHRSEILVGDIRSAELQIRKELSLSAADVAVFTDSKRQRWLPGLDSLTLKKCDAAGGVCRDWSSHTILSYQPIYFDDAKTSLWGFLYIEKKPQTQWLAAISVAAVFFLGMIIQVFGMYLNLTRTTSRMSTTLFKWAQHLSTNPKARVKHERAPFSEFDPIESALAKLTTEIAQLETIARREGALETLRGVGHDLLNPVSRMKRILGVIATDKSETVSIDLDSFMMLQSNLKRLSDHAEQLKVMYKRDLGEAHADTSITNVSDEIESLVGELAFDPDVTESGIKIETSIGAHCMAAIAPNALGRMIENLCTNAIHASSANGIVRVTVRSIENKIEITVKDSGTGIPLEIQNKIFESGFTSRTNKGTGLGLFVVKQICEQYRGTIELESKVGCGARFTITIPKVEMYELQNSVS